MPRLQTENNLDDEEFWNLFGVDEERIRKKVRVVLKNLGKAHKESDISIAIDNESIEYSQVIRKLILEQEVK